MDHAHLDLLIAKHTHRHHFTETVFEAYDPDTVRIILSGREQKHSWLNKIFRATGFPVDSEMALKNANGEMVYRFVANLESSPKALFVLDHQDVRIAYFRKSKGEEYDVTICWDDDTAIGFLNRRSWLKRAYQVIGTDQRIIASIAAKNLSSFEEFSRRDNTFAIEVDEGIPQDHFLRRLLIPAVVYINWFGL